MLVLSRKESERIRLGDCIVITVVRVSGDKVRLGIDAPPNILVLREELQPHQEKPEKAHADAGAVVAPTPSSENSQRAVA